MISIIVLKESFGFSSFKDEADKNLIVLKDLNLRTKNEFSWLNHKNLKCLIAKCDQDIPSHLARRLLMVGDSKSFIAGGSRVWNGVKKGFVRDVIKQDVDRDTISVGSRW